MYIFRNDVASIIKELPVEEEFCLENPVDILICTLGFEDRTHAIVDKLDSKGFLNNTNILLITYPTNFKQNELNYKYFKDAASNSYIKRLSYNCGSYANDIKEYLQSMKTSDGRRVIFDISTCSSYVFYPTMRELLNHDFDLTIAYSEALNYYPKYEDWKAVANKADKESTVTLLVKAFETAEFQSLGVDNIYPYVPFDDFSPGNRPTMFIAIPNFNAMRMKAIITRNREINNTPYERIMWIIGQPPGEGNKWRVEAVKRTNIHKNIQSGRIINVSTIKYREIIEALENIWEENKYKYHLVIGSLGSKMQHVGTFIFLCLHKDIGVWLAEPKSFRAQQFSNGIGDIWQIRFGSIKKYNDLLDKYGAFELGR